ncbi:hypothetical protein SAMN05444395_1111 [Flavobacterium fryxellicola]|uniref:Uncharacterized protein n=1 Tax=Flavobacterium fryxellicola TaxID=249352 RepID=A0A167ZJU3_9FLAO|nr:hypothetical protein [Flavobacterium fryxellicola]OAB30523.1 hypothetical protein FBFR_01620 [Flavobacterium fryxellicola]SHN76772.1 hypothetical protein SAMN05444395_1111 [Flavobacterium fryxellicola]
MNIGETGILMMVGEGGIGNKDAARCLFMFFLIMRKAVKDWNYNGLLLLDRNVRISLKVGIVAMI